MWLMVPSQALVAKHLESLKEFPPTGGSSLSIDAVLQQFKDAAATAVMKMSHQWSARRSVPLNAIYDAQIANARGPRFCWLGRFVGTSLGLMKTLEMA